MRRRCSPHRPRQLARQRAVQALYQLQVNPGPPSAVIDQFLASQDFSRVDKAYFRTLVIRAAGREQAIARDLEPYLDIDRQQLDHVEWAVLQVAWVELCEHPELPVRVVLDEAIELARRFGAEQSHTFINGVLDRFARRVRKQEVETLIARDDR